MIAPLQGQFSTKRTHGFATFQFYAQHYDNMDPKWSHSSPEWVILIVYNCIHANAG